MDVPDARAEAGFTLIELLVVILIIGILAAIAIPAFLDQRRKGQDGSIKSNVRSLVSEIAACYVDREDYSLCDEESELASPGVPMAAAACAGTPANPTAPAMGLVCAIGSGDDFGVAGSSRSGNTFRWLQDSGNPPTRECDTDDFGGCPADGNW